MLGDEKLTLGNGIRASHTAGLVVTVVEGRTPSPARDRDVIVRYTIDVDAPAAGGQLTVTAERQSGRVVVTVLLVVADRLEVVSAAPAQPDERTFTVDVSAGHPVTVLVVEHPAELDAADVVALLTRAEPGATRAGRTAAPPPAPMAPPPSMDRSTVDGGGGYLAEEELSYEPAQAFPEATGAEPEPVERAMAEPEEATSVLAEVGANMPSTVHVDDAVPVEVLLSSGEVTVHAGTAHDEQVVVMDPRKPLDVVILRRGFDLDQRELPHETGRRTLWLPAVTEQAARVVFWLRAAQEGEGEVQVVVRQEHPQPLATLRLTATVLPSTGTPVDRAAAEAALQDRTAVHRESLAGRVKPFANPQTLVIDENLVGAVSELSFDLVLPGFRRSYSHLVPDKGAVLKEVYRLLDAAWRDAQMEELPARGRFFQDRLQALGSWLAPEVLPQELLDELRTRIHDIDELAIITSGETDIPWELVHIGVPGAAEDVDGRGFLGRAGLVRWVYNTPHPTDLSIREGRGFYLVPQYVDPELVLEETSLESTNLERFGAVAVQPPDSAGIARVLTGGEVDLLHFAGHGSSNDNEVPPVREMLLGEYRKNAVLEAGADRSRVAFSLEDLRQALQDRAFTEPGPLVFLNACRLGTAPSTRSEAGGFAETFLRGGAAAFVGCLWSVGDRSARRFVSAFYEALDAGHTVAHATLMGRRAAREAGDTSWLAYTVYAHPDARLADRPIPTTETVSSSKGTPMTTTSDAARKVPDLTREQLRVIHPYVISMEDGRLAEGAPALPDGVDDFRTVRADIDDLFATRLPAFVAAHGTPVPMALWAHGGLVGKASGLRVAHTQITWWLANDVFPVHFVWRTGLAESLWDAVKDRLKRPRGLDDIWDHAIETAARIGQGKDVWGAMKTTARLSNEPDTGGAWYFAQKLGEFVQANPGSVTVHATGHSAGSIFHSYLIPEMLAAGVDRVASLNLLAPAIRVDEFKQRIMADDVFDKIDKLSLFTMSEPFERRDTCMGVYRKSLLYLIRGALEPEREAEILGLQECLLRDPALAVLLGKAGSGEKGEVMWSQTVGGGPRTSSCSTTHGGFDNDRQTMNSLARRILDDDRLKAEFGSLPATRGAVGEDSPWLSEQEALSYLASHGEAAQPGGRRALCIGIDDYPSAQDQLHGCVADARAWARALGDAGFAVEVVENGDATRQNIVEKIQALILDSRSGDVLVVQYSGHGTTIDDLDGDDLQEAERTGETRDEALCPVDFREGELLIDDDLGQLWDMLPDGVNLTVFFDACHSGGTQRAVLEAGKGDATRKARLARMTPPDVAAYKAKRGSAAQATRSLDSERAIYFGACQATEVAYESNGQGDFTRIALLRLPTALSGTNQEFFDAVLKDFGDSRQQTPVLLPPRLVSQGFLSPQVRAGAGTDLALPPGEGAGTVPAATPAAVPRPPTATAPRDRAVATILRGVADLLES